MIKKTTLLLAALLPVLAWAQAPVPPTETTDNARLNSIKLYPFAFIKSRFAVSYERALTNRWSVQAGLGVVSNDKSDFYSGRNVFGYSADVQFRKYLQPNQERLEGIYFAPHIGIKTLEFDTEDYYWGPWTGSETITFSSTAVNAGLVMGYQLQILEVVVADVYAGGGYRHTNPNSDFSHDTNIFNRSELREYSSSGVFPTLGLQIGILF